ncbi:hypothetical protein LB505_014008 [Fusarium chuoi]|nr:hypothetical protein LB505_014008 [Fusarium chuoi]
MAEVDGLALGVLGLAGLIGAFKDTINVFNIVVDMRHMGRQYQRHGLRLENDTETPISAGLEPDFSDLPARLFGGPIPLGQQRDQSQSGWRFSQKRMKSFMKRLEALPVPEQGQATPTCIAQKTRWVIRDKQKFEVLIQDLAELTTKLSQVVPPSNSETARSMIQSDIELIKKDVRKPLLFQEASEGDEYFAQENLDRMCQARILNILWFRMINDGSESISQNHRDTLQWDIGGSKNTESWHDLPSWLLNGSGIYWVFGKARSGKSTLIKFVFRHHPTTSILSQWDNGGDCSHVITSSPTWERISRRARLDSPVH